MLRLIAIITVAVAAVVCLRVLGFHEGFSVFEACVAVCLLVATYAGPVFRVSWHNKQIEVAYNQMDEVDLAILAWEERFQKN